MYDRERKNKSGSLTGKIIAVIIVILSALPDEITPRIIGLAVIAAVGYVVFLIVKKALSAPRQQRNTYSTRNREVFDDCPKPFCFHRDKGEHHLRKGKEIDPWDRPDIDISKYQRRQ